MCIKRPKIYKKPELNPGNKQKRKENDRQNRPVEKVTRTKKGDEHKTDDDTDLPFSLSFFSLQIKN